MGKIVQGEFGAQARRKKHKRSTLCDNDHHSWKALDQMPFDVKKGRLIIAERCKRCGKTRTLSR